MRRYDGNTGRYRYIPDSPQETIPPPVPPKPAPPQPGPKQKTMPPPNPFGGGLQSLLSKLSAQGVEIEDLLLFAVLFLMYQETKDKELLVIMGSMFLL